VTWHSDPRVVDENKLNPMQKHNRRVDEYKNKWALAHGIPIMRIWEKDIREAPDKVLKELKERLYIEDKKVTLTEKKNKRHINKIK
jgi:very-short-patch-repair endonuclease